MQETPRSQDQYFASLPPREFIDEAHARIGDYYDDLRESGLYPLWEKSYRAYYGARLTGGGKSGKMFDASEITQGGKNGEIAHFKVNHYRNLLKHTLQLSTSMRPAFACRATNSDYKSQTQAILGNGLLDYYLREKKLQQFLTRSVECSLVFSEGWIHCPWDPTTGEQYGVNPDTGAVVYEGDLSFEARSPLDIVRDVDTTDEDQHDWLMVRGFKNRWSLAAKHKDVADDILSLSTDSMPYETTEAFNLRPRGKGRKSDRLCVWTFYHKKTDAMPQGRMVQFVGDVLLFDGPIPYRRIPLHRVCPDTLIDTPYGYTPAFDILGPQHGLDILNSALMSNSASYAMQNIWAKRGDTVTVSNLTGGGKLIQSDEKPEALQLTESPVETFNFRKDIVGEMETLAGVSATVRGNPEANLKSGSALALVVSQSIQFASLLEASYNTLFEDVGTDIIMQLRDFSQTDRVANIIGEASRPFRKEFKGDDLDSINRVVVDATSPLSKTVAGRVEMANDLWEKGLIETAKQYIMVLTTGQLDPAIEGSQHELLNIRAENEDMRSGSQVLAAVTDIHADHIREHRSLLSNPEARKNPDFIRLVTAHIQEHIQLWRTADPAILMITGQQPAPPPLMMPPMGPVTGGPGPMPGGPSGPQGGPPPGPGGLPRVVSPQKPTDAEQPNMPNMPGLPPGSPDEAQAAFDKAS